MVHGAISYELDHRDMRYFQNTLDDLIALETELATARKVVEAVRDRIEEPWQGIFIEDLKKAVAAYDGATQRCEQKYSTPKGGL